ncbi:hypothetical protein DVG80_22630 [Rhodococcus erythropolis]|uniref:Lsr2 family protein n=1 Tax=Rhodococcus qingshengii TaxID=334542 RepID=UPI000ACD4F36|nr:Lsr2 family protein [Rhodococcus qingshengii]REK82034.1 hypothetical protein DVG80_22630 [Rhodococcus erythropolis]
MAERVIRQLIDDLDGKPIDDGFGERIQFSYHGCVVKIAQDETLTPNADVVFEATGFHRR